MKLINRNLILLIAAIVSSSLFLLTGCAEEPVPESASGYGYVQFHLFKAESYDAATRAGGKLEYLRDAAKIRVTLRSEDNDIITPVAVVESVDAEISEWGLQTAKIRLQAGRYTLTAYEVYDGLDRSVIVGAPSETMVIDVPQDGLVSRDIALDVTGRGWAKFSLTKDLSELTKAAAKDGADEYPFYAIQSVDLTVKNKVTNELTEITDIEVVHQFKGDEKSGYVSGVCVSDTLVLLKAGTYTVTRFRTYFDYFRKVYETSTNVAENEFVVKDNRTTDAEVPVTLHTTSGHIADALALREIWEALDGPNWRVKWDFNCDADVWTANSGIQVLGNGRVAALDLTGTGAKGAIPAAISKLTELRKLTIGTMDYNAGTANASTSNATAAANRSGKNGTVLYSQEDHASVRRSIIGKRDPRSRFSKELQLSFEIAGNPVQPDTRSLRDRVLYGTETADAAENGGITATKGNEAGSAAVTGNWRPEIYATEITSIPEEINSLKNLEHITVCYSPFTTFPDDMSGCTALTDIEIFACPEMTEFPKGITTLPNLVSLVFAFNDNVPASSTEEGIALLNTQPCSKTLQLLYFPNQRIDIMPDLSKIPHLSVLTAQQCGLKGFTTPFGKDHALVQLMVDNNELSDLPRDAEGYFVGLSAETEELNFSNNRFTVMPDIFDAKSAYMVGTIDFSHNRITAMENGSAYKGLKAATLDLSYNGFSEFPVELYGTSGSSISYLKFDANGIEKVSKEALDGEYTYRTTTLSMAYNKIKSLPDEFDSLTFPYMSGMDLSYNRFDYFPYTAINNQYLTVFIFRHQRDADGDRCMRTWPSGIGQALAGLRALYLGSNDIRVVTDQLSYMIYNLDIMDNPNISIDVSAVCPYIRSGFFNLMYSPGQDIRGCDDVLKL